MNLKVIFAIGIVAVGIIAFVYWKRGEVRTMISQAQAQKSNGEGLAALIKQEYQMRRINENQYNEAQLRYLRAYAASNAWAGYMISSMRTSMGVDVAGYRRQLADANRYSKEWIDWGTATHASARVQAQSTSTASLPEWVNIPDLLDKLQDLDTQQRQDFINNLNGCIWKPFEEIPPAQ